MRIGQSIWSRDDFNLQNPRSLLLFPTSTNSFVKFYSESLLQLQSDFKDPNDDEQNSAVPSAQMINSSKKLFLNPQFRSRIYESRQCKLADGTVKTIYYFHSTKISIDETGPFWPMAFPIKHPSPSFLSINSKRTKREYYHRLDQSKCQTFDNQPAMFKYTDPIKYPIVIYDMDKSARDQQAKTSESEFMCPALIFESRFEGGNLRQVKRIGQFEYELMLRPDLYTRRHTQWYYFRVQNMIANITYRFRIINLVKKTSLYKDGMQILLFSDLNAKRDSRGWYRAGHHINYAEYKQKSYNALLERDINYYELDFQLEFDHTGDTCYIAHCYPYTFTDLKEDLDRLSSIRPKDVFRREVLCESQAGNSCFIVTVTDESVPIEEKKFVFITARIHPGETNSSFMMRGLLEFITSDDRIAKNLRSQLIFKIVPMLNPDGVIIGNYRCSLTGKDMNRNFRHPRKQTFPTIYHIKEMMQSLQKENREILAFCDLHGHSRKSNVFAYGCDGCDGPQPDMKNFLNARVLPFIMSRTAPEMFAFDYCKFHIHRCKESTGRVVMWKEMLIKNSFTLEASFAGSSIVEKPCHFNIQDFEKFGQYICESLRQYLYVLSDTTRLDSIFLDITKNVLRKLGKDKLPPALLLSLFPEEKQSNDEESLPINSVMNCLQALTQCHETITEQEASSSSSDSDSDPEGGEIPDLTYNKDESTSKKKLKKKRSDKAIEDRVDKLNKKREVNRPSKPGKAATATNLIAPTIEEAAAATMNNATSGSASHTQRQPRHTYPFTAEIDMNTQLKLTLDVDQMDKATRALPPRGNLFVSKYVNRSGHGLPIFTTERAMERKLKRGIIVAPDVPLERSLAEDYETDHEPDSPGIPDPSQMEASIHLDKETASGTGSTNTVKPAIKRAPSFISLTLKDLPDAPTDQPVSTITGTHVNQGATFKTLTQRRLQRLYRRHHSQNPAQPLKTVHKVDVEPFSNPKLPSAPPVVPNLMELALRSSPMGNQPTSIDSELSHRFTYETHTDNDGIPHHRLQTIPDSPLRSSSTNGSPIIRTHTSFGIKMPTIGTNHQHHHQDSNHRRTPSNRANTIHVQPILPNIDAVLRERSLVIANENMPHIDAMDRVHQVLKNFYVSNDKK